MDFKPKRGFLCLFSMAAAVFGLLALRDAAGFQAPPAGQDAQKELFAARYANAADLYSKRLAENPRDSEAYYGLVRALLRDHRSQEAYAAAESASRLEPPTAASLAAAGLANYRNGDVTKAETDFREALKLNTDYPGALAGLSEIYSTVSKFRTAQNLIIEAYRRSPSDPELMLGYANSLQGAEHISELERALDSLDPASEIAKNLRAHIASDRAGKDRELRRLISPYEKSRIKMGSLLNGPNHLRGYGVKVRLNGSRTVTLLLDTGASGISISPKAAERAGLEKLGETDSETKGIGDQKAQETSSYLASELRIGEVTFADYPVSAFRAANSPDYDGLMGADVLRQFIVALDFPNSEIELEPRPGGLPPKGPVDAQDSTAPGFYRVLRFSDHLVLPARMNEKTTGLFLMDSGSAPNLIDMEAAKKASSTYSSPLTVLKGLQGKVDKVSRAERISLVFAGFRQDNPDLIAFDMTKIGDGLGVRLSGILGLPVLSQLKVTIDYTEGAVKLEQHR